MKIFAYTAIAAVTIALGACASKNYNTSEAEVNDSTSPLHLLRPEYSMPYGELSADSVRATVDRIFNYIGSVTPAVVVDSTGKVIDNPKIPLSEGAKLNQGTFRLTSYEWGVMYDALLAASEILNDSKYAAYY